MQMRMEGRKRRASVKENEKPEKAMDFSGMSLDTLPNPHLNLASITNLNLSNNNLEVIPESVTARLINVVILDVHSNQLKALPNSIGCLSKLKVLDVSGNLLESLPWTIENCRALEEVILNFNKLTALPDTIGFELTNLRKLSVNSNKLQFLPHSTSHMTSLRALDAHLNCLHSLPEGLENLTSLEYLDVSRNFQHLSSLPYALGLLSSLHHLDVSYNNVSSLPDSLGCLSNLTTLKAEGNPLVCPPFMVVDRGVAAVREYLGARMNRTEKRGSWIGKIMIRCGTTKGRRSTVGGDKYRSIDGFATPPPREATSPLWALSPRRLFGSPSPKN